MIELHLEVRGGTKSSVRRAALRRVVKAEQVNRCLLCGGRLPSDRLSIDHVLRRDCGGRSERKNLRAICYHCHAVLNYSQEFIRPEMGFAARVSLGLQVARAMFGLPLADLGSKLLFRVCHFRAAEMDRRPATVIKQRPLSLLGGIRP
jgi:hypothetical protein